MTTDVSLTGGRARRKPGGRRKTAEFDICIPSGGEYETKAATYYHTSKHAGYITKVRSAPRFELPVYKCPSRVFCFRVACRRTALTRPPACLRGPLHFTLVCWKVSRPNACAYHLAVVRKPSVLAPLGPTHLGPPPRRILRPLSPRRESRDRRRRTPCTGCAAAHARRGRCRRTSCNR